MTEPPRYPKAGGNPKGEEPTLGENKRNRSNMILVAIIVGALLVLMIVLHVTGVVGANTNI